MESSRSQGKNGVANGEVRVGALTAHPRNYNQHSAGQVGDLRRFGQVRSIVVQAQADGARHLIVAGHGIVQAARAEGIESLRADIIPADWDDAMVLAYLAADNELARQGEPDEAQLAALLRDVAATADRELAALAAGSEARLTEMLATLDGAAEGDAEPQVDRAAELQVKWQVRTGDVWRIGVHRLACGDCTDKAVVERVMGGERAALCLTDPPYGIDIVKVKGGGRGQLGGEGGPTPFGGVRNKGRVGFSNLVAAREYSPIIGDDRPFDPTPLLDMADEQIIFGANFFASKLPDGKAWIVWDKDASGMFSPCELAWTSRAGRLYMYRHMWSGLRREGSRDIELTQRVHPTQKPVGLFEAILADFSAEAAIIIDPFLGSGTTLVACERLGRRGRGIEISPEYCAVVLERMATAFPGIEIERMLPRAKMDLSDENGAA